MRLVSAFLLAVTLAACSAPVDMEKTQAAVLDFHQKLTAGDDEGIYRGAAQGLRDATTLENWKHIDDLARAAMANHCAAPPTSPTTWNVFYGTGGQRITLIYSRTCGSGDLVENFVYQLENGEPKLLGYHISGNALLAVMQIAPAATASEKPTADATATTTATATATTETSTKPAP